MPTLECKGPLDWITKALERARKMDADSVRVQDVVFEDFRIVDGIKDEEFDNTNWKGYVLPFPGSDRMYRIIHVDHDRVSSFFVGRMPVAPWVRSPVVEVVTPNRNPFPVTKDFLISRVYRAMDAVEFLRMNSLYDAEERAYRLFVSHITKKQYDDWKRRRKLTFEGGDGKRYQIGRGAYNVEELGHGFYRNGMCYMPHNSRSLPEYDVILAQMLTMMYEPKLAKHIANYRY